MYFVCKHSSSGINSCVIFHNMYRVISLVHLVSHIISSHCEVDRTVLVTTVAIMQSPVTLFTFITSTTTTVTFSMVTFFVTCHFSICYQ